MSVIPAKAGIQRARPLSDTGFLRPETTVPMRRAQAGLTLIELIVFIVIITVGLAGILAGLNYSIRNSANPMLLKQQVAVAESLLEEITKKPFTWCDPDDASAPTATSYATCSAPAASQQTGPQTGEDRYNQAAPFDNVIDYNGFSMTGIRSPTNGSSTISGLGSYSALVGVTPAGAALGLADNTAALRIDVTVGLAGQPSVVVTGYRYRYAPQSF
ncbi:prepilin-type N-terminal cleavage/methylation domain-containing protein [Uliginosibacterium sp. H3]|uniref:Prepilin-type N-terminal cleavage/methylation domain-containing protein n=1 Tax=Uliginosibacterium silvisoli TaxID=3114758 RepID=A0ABU6K2P6_9RHOO|nr:prepilin-type N-terminal cleavage/methylation domain-containing protein [Uliginosibacterium sp. H3]